VTIAAKNGNASVFGHRVSTLQSGITIADGAITGTLKYVDEGALPTTWGAGNFLALKFEKTDENVTDIKVGLRPSQGSGLVSLDDDMDGAFKITNTSQKFVIQQWDDNNHMSEQVFDLSGLTLETE